MAEPSPVHAVSKNASKDVAKQLPPEPAYVAHRIRLWEELKAKESAARSPYVAKAEEAKKIIIVLPDGKKIEGEVWHQSTLLCALVDSICVLRGISTAGEKIVIT